MSSLRPVSRRSGGDGQRHEQQAQRREAGGVRDVVDRIRREAVRKGAVHEHGRRNECDREDDPSQSADNSQ